MRKKPECNNSGFLFAINFETKRKICQIFLHLKTRQSKTMEDTIKIYLADDHQILLDGIQVLLQTIPNFEVVGLSLSGASLYQEVIDSKAEILIEKELIKVDSISMEYFIELLKEVKEFYKKNNFTKISTDSLKNFKYIYNILVLEYIKSDVINFKSNDSSGSSGSSDSSKQKSDHVIDVELADET